MIGIRQIPSFLRMAANGETRSGLDSDPRRSSAPALAGYGDAYNEEAFQHLLTVERKRYERSNRPFVLALIELETRPGQPDRMHPAVSASVFDSLARSLRETDVVGWYRQGRIVGAVLTHLGDGVLSDVSRETSKRVSQMLHAHLPGHIANRLKVRLYQPLEMLRS